MEGPRHVFAGFLLFVAFLEVPTAAYAQSLAVPGQRYRDVPQGRTGCTGLCEELKHGPSNEGLLRDNERDFTRFVDERRNAQFWGTVSGQASKTLGYGVLGAEEAVVGYLTDFSDVGTLGGTATLKVAMIAGVSGVGMNILGESLVDYGDRLQEQASKDFTEAVIIDLAARYNQEIINTDGSLNKALLSNIRDSDLGFALKPEFQKQVGDPLITSQLFNRITIDQLQLAIQGIDRIDRSGGDISKSLRENSKALDQVIATLSKLAERSQVAATQLGRMAQEPEHTAAMLDALARSNLPDAQKLALYQKGLLQFDEATVIVMAQRVSAADLQASFDQASGAMKGIAQAFSDLGLGEAAGAAANMGRALDLAASIGVAWTMGNPLGVAQGAIGMIGLARSFGGGGPSPEVRMLKEVMAQIYALRQEMRQYHIAEMRAIQDVAERIEGLRDLVELRFAELSLDLALLQYDVQELLYDDVRACQRLVVEFRLPETQVALDGGVVGFARWFETDGRVSDFDQCLDGLISRQEVRTETDFSGVLRISSGGGDGAFADERRAGLRRIEMGVLQPMVRFTRAYGDLSSPETARNLLFPPVYSVCTVLAQKGAAALSTVCPEEAAAFWPPSRVATSQYNPGQGALLSPTAVLTMADYAITVAPWNTVLIDRSTAPLPRVRTDQEIAALGVTTASRRTRHMLALNNSADALDLVLAQIHLMSGVPVIAKAAQVVDETIIPAYAVARLRGNPEKLNALLSSAPQDRGQGGPDCATTWNEKGEKRSLEDRAAWNTLCMMQANPTFANNVVRAVIARRLGRSGATWEDWRRAVRAPYSQHLNQLVGQDVLFLDAALTEDGKGAIDRSFGTWAIQLPRVEAVPIANREKLLDEAEKDSSKRPSCWQKAPVPSLDQRSDYYRLRSSADCYLLDGAMTDNFAMLDLSPAHSALVSRRMVVRDMIVRFCAAVGRFPTAYCPVSDSVGIGIAHDMTAQVK